MKLTLLRLLRKLGLIKFSAFECPICDELIIVMYSPVASRHYEFCSRCRKSGATARFGQWYGSRNVKD